MPEHAPLEQRIEAVEADLQQLERESLLTSDPIRRQRLADEILASLRRLFDYRKRRDALARGGELLESLPATISTATAEYSRVFIGFHPRDRKWAERLSRHLEPLLGTGPVESWDPSRAQADEPWREELEVAIESAQVAVVLVSADYLASALAVEEEIPLLLESARDRGLVLLPVIVGPAAFARSPLARVRPVNPPSSPLASKGRAEQEKLLETLALSIERYIRHDATR